MREGHICPPPLIEIGLIRCIISNRGAGQKYESSKVTVAVLFIPTSWWCSVKGSVPSVSIVAPSLVRLVLCLRLFEIVFLPVGRHRGDVTKCLLLTLWGISRDGCTALMMFTQTLGNE